MKMQCIVCGGEADMGSLCSKCWLRGKELFTISDFEAVICECSSILSGRSWKKIPSLENALEDEISRRIKTSGKISKIKCSFGISGTIVKARIICKGKIKPCKMEKEEEKEITIMLRKAKCEECKKDAASYYEAVIQLRVPELINKIEKMSGETLSSVHEVRGGFDLYLKSNAKAKSISSWLLQKGFAVVRSVVFVTRKNNKNIYKNYYSVKGDNIGRNTKSEDA